MASAGAGTIPAAPSRRASTSGNVRWAGVVRVSTFTARIPARVTVEIFGSATTACIARRTIGRSAPQSSRAAVIMSPAAPWKGSKMRIRIYSTYKSLRI